MTNVESAYGSWRSLPFPPGSATDERVDELHADLGVADALVADTVIPFVEDGRYEPGSVDLIAQIEDISRKAAELERVVAPEDAGLIRAYTEYADALMQIYRAVLAADAQP